MQFNKNPFSKRLKSMLQVDFRRMFTTPLYYIMVAVSLVMPILILVMTTMMDGTVSVDPQTGAQTIIEGFKNVWQIIGSVSGETMSMDITSMCNINMLFFVIAVFVCIFVSDDFRSGYAKNLFTVRAKKTEYVISKTVVCFVAGASMLIAFFLGAILGGMFSGLSFALQGVTAANIALSMLTKIFIVAIFVAIYVLASVIAKQKLWLSLLLSFGIGMLFFTMLPIISPLNSGILNLLLSFVGSGIFSFAIGAASYIILNKTTLV